MDNFYNPFSSHSSRIGFHYFPDTLHFRDADMQTWLPELTSLGASWLVIKSAHHRAIPEPFISELIKSNIEPLVQFDLSLNEPANPVELQLILENYSRWGVKGILLFNRPNARASWSASSWAQQNLVDHFLDRFLPLAKVIDQLGMNAIFPPLQPSGSYWDTAFLKASLEGISRRKQDSLLDHMVLSCFGWTQHRSLNWGSGGPNRWITSRPYFTPPDGQDQNGFRIYEWYQSAVQPILQREVPIIMLQTSLSGDPENPPQVESTSSHAEIKAVSQLLLGDIVSDESDISLDPIPAYVLSGAFWLLSADSSSRFSSQAWYRFDGGISIDVQMLKNLTSSLQSSKTTLPAQTDPSHPIQHYLLLPSYEWGIADWNLDAAKPFIRKYRPAIGFSLDEAALAREVTVIDNSGAFSEERLDQLRLSGSLVRRISTIGIEIASQIAER